MREGINELRATIDAVGKDMPEFGKAVSQALQQRYCTVNILNVGGMNVDGEQKAILLLQRPLPCSWGNRQ